MTVTIETPIGIGARLDGGPFDNATVTDIPEGGVVTLEHGTGGSPYPAPLNHVGDDVADEIGSGEPMFLSTGSVDEDALAGTIDVPLSQGYYVVIEVPGGGSEYGAGRLIRNESIADQVERALKRHGGRIEPM